MMKENTTRYRIMGATVETDGETARIVRPSPYVQKEEDRELVKRVAKKRYRANE